MKIEPPDPISWSPMGEAAVVVEFGDRIDLGILRNVWALADILERQPIPGLIECVPAYTTVTVLFDPIVTDAAEVDRRIGALIPQLRPTQQSRSRTIEIPVCYGGEFGPDLEFVAEHCGLHPNAVIEIHSQMEYLVHLIGFAPGFPYLGGMSPKIAAPRLDSPRLRIPQGSVGIAGEQTGIYPLATPGGWRLIGRTPLALFRPTEMPPILLRAGDAIRFKPITAEQFRIVMEQT